LNDQPITIVVAEPDEPLRKGLASLLMELGPFLVVEAANGSQAWSLLRRGQGQFLIASWNMPEMSGLALLKVLRADATLAALPVMLMAEDFTKGQVIEAGEAGVSDLVLLPLSPQVLKRKLCTLLELEQDPHILEAERSYEEGLELMAQSRWEEALVAFKRVITIHENPEVYYNMGYIKTAQGRYEEAIQFFRKATQINNAFAKAYEKMGECYLELGRPKLAEQSFQRAAEIYLEKRMDDSAEHMLQEVLKLNPQTINVFNALGIIYRRQGRYQDALEQYKKALKVSPFDENIYYNMGRIYLEQRLYHEARPILRKAVEINPGFNEAAEMLRSLELRMKEGGLD
jgi:tetratricopeptide (TPR) repeat protein